MTGMKSSLHKEKSVGNLKFCSACPEYIYMLWLCYLLAGCFVASIDELLVRYDVNIILNLLHFTEPLESRPTVGAFDVTLLSSLGLGQRSCQTEVLRWRVTLL